MKIVHYFKDRKGSLLLSSMFIDILKLNRFPFVYFIYKLAQHDLMNKINHGYFLFLEVNDTDKIIPTKDYVILSVKEGVLHDINHTSNE